MKKAKRTLGQKWSYDGQKGKAKSKARQKTKQKVVWQLVAQADGKIDLNTYQHPWNNRDKKMKLKKMTMIQNLKILYLTKLMLKLVKMVLALCWLKNNWKCRLENKTPHQGQWHRLHTLPAYTNVIHANIHHFYVIMCIYFTSMTG